MATLPIKNPTRLTDFDPKNHQSGNIYPLQNPLDQGYGVTAFPKSPSKLGANARFVNIRGEAIEFWIEEMTANFGMTGTTGQSHKLRQFFPHNIVQPSITVTGIAPNSYQYNRLAAFIRVAQHDGLLGQELRTLGIPLRNVIDSTGQTVLIPTVQLIIRNGSGAANGKGGGNFPYDGVRKNLKGVKGTHQAWKLEGYIKTMQAGASGPKGGDSYYAPAFQFEFLISESQGPSGGNSNIGIWNDVSVSGDDILPWIDIFKASGKKGFQRDKVPPIPSIPGIVGGIL